jgi:hypothetical protein
VHIPQWLSRQPPERSEIMPACGRLTGIELKNYDLNLVLGPTPKQYNYFHENDKGSL